MPNWMGLYAEVGLNIDEYCKVETSHTGDWIELDMSGGSVDAHLTISSAAVVRLIDALSVELEKFRSARVVHKETEVPSAVVAMSGNHEEQQRYGHPETAELSHASTRP